MRVLSTLVSGFLFALTGTVRAEPRIVEIVASASDVRAAGFLQEDLYLGTTGGLVRVRPDRTLRQFTSMDGLPSHAVRALVVQGNTLWLGTDAGIVEWQNDHVVRVLESRAVIALASDGTENVWAATTDGKVWKTGDELEPVPVRIRGTLYSLAARSGCLYLGTSRGVYVWNGSSTTRLRGSLPHPAALSLATHGDSLLVGTPAGVASIRVIGGETSLASRPNAQPYTNALNGSPIRPPMQVADTRSVVVHRGRIVVGTWGGGAYVRNNGRSSWIAGTNGLRVQVVAVSDAGQLVIGHAGGALLNGISLRLAALPSNDLTAIAISGRTRYVGTFDKGLFALGDDGTVKTWTERSGLLDNRINALAIHEAALWIALEHGVCKLDINSGRIERCWRSGDGPAPGHAMAVLSYDGGVLTGSSGGLARWDGQRWHAVSLPFRRITALERGRHLWVGSAEGLARLDANTLSLREFRNAASGGLPDDWVTLVREDANGVWIGTYSSGLAYLQNDSGSPWIVERTVWINPAAMAPLGSDFLFGTLGDGLLMTNTRRMRYVRRGLPSLDVTSIVPNADGTAWVATRGGLAKIRL